MGVEKKIFLWGNLLACWFVSYLLFVWLSNRFVWSRVAVFIRGDPTVIL